MKVRCPHCGRKHDLPKGIIQQKEYYSVKEFAELIGVSAFTVWRWTSEDRIKYKQVHVGCKIMIPHSEYERLKGERNEGHNGDP